MKKSKIKRFLLNSFIFQRFHKTVKVTIPVKKEYPIGTAKAILDVIAKTENKSRRDIVEEFDLKL